MCCFNALCCPRCLHSMNVITCICVFRLNFFDLFIVCIVFNVCVVLFVYMLLLSVVCMFLYVCACSQLSAFSLLYSVYACAVRSVIINIMCCPCFIDVFVWSMCLLCGCVHVLHVLRSVCVVCGFLTVCCFFYESSSCDAMHAC